MPTKQAEPVLKSEVATILQEPSMFRIIFLNDNVTSMDFVIEVLVGIFDYTVETAYKITVDIHEQGSAVVAVLPFELAEQKSAEVLVYAKANKFPLQTRIEPEV